MIMFYSKFHWSVSALVLLCSMLFFAGCASTTPSSNIPHANDPERVKAFQERIISVAKEIKNMPNYKRIPLDTSDEQGWFAGIAFQYWDNQITREEFVSTGVRRFPDHRASFETVAEKLK